MLVEQIEAAAGIIICLRDDSGVFLGIEPELETELESKGEELGDRASVAGVDDASGEVSREGEGAEGGDPQQLDALQRENPGLVEENEELRGTNTELLEENERL